MSNPIFVTSPSMPSYEEYCSAIKPLWDSHWITNMGFYHRELEKELKNYLNIPVVSLTVNGHMALEMALQSFDFPIDSEIITTPFTFISTTHAIVRNYLRPVFCDIKKSNGTIDETKIEKLITSKTVAILPVHVYGHICNVERIQEIANKYGLKVIYDACHAFGEKYKGVGVANFGDASVFSFHATKVFNTIEGGAVCSKDARMYEKIYDLKNFGIHGEESVTGIGANAKMNEFAAIMGLLNLKKTNQEIAKRKRIYEKYQELLCDIENIRFFDLSDDVEYNYGYVPIIIENVNAHHIKEKLMQHEIYVRRYFYPITCDQECYYEKYGYSSVPIARELSEKMICLPIYGELSDADIERTASLLKCEVDISDN